MVAIVDTMITTADTDSERREMQALFDENFSDIAADAVPMVASDDLYAPLVVRCIDDATGVLIGGALTCRAQLAAAAIHAERSGLSLGGYSRLRDKHSELDLMCVALGYRGRGIGGQMIEFMEGRLRERGVRVWFGNATEDLDVDRLRAFYTRHGFVVLDEGQPLPPLLGQTWTPPNTAPTAMYFYKVLQPVAS